MIIVNFDPGRTMVSKKGLWQYDYGQVLRITGLDLPKVVEVHFSFQEYDGDAEIAVGSTKDKITEVEIPKFALDGNGQLCGRIYYVFAFVYVENGETGRTKYKIRLDINARPKPEDYTEPEHEELFGQVIKEVNEAVERVEAAEGKAKEYADKTTEDAQNTAADRKEVERLVESVSDIDDKVEEIEGYRDQSLTAAGNALQSEQNAKTSEEMARDYAASAEVSENAARTYAEQTEQAKAVVMELGQQVADDKTHVDKIAQDFTLTVQQATADINNTGQEQTERVQTAGDTAVDDINTAKDTALNQITDEGEKQVTAIETSGSQQTGIVTAEGEKQVEAIQQAASEIIADRELIRTNTENIARLDDEVDLLAPAIIQTANGEFVQIKDSAEKKIAGLKIFGKSEQNTTQGYQLLPVPLGKEIVSLDKEVNAVVEEDGIILTYNYNSLTTSSDIYFAGDNNATIETGYEECMQAGTYNVHFEQESTELLFYVVVWKNGSSSVLLNLSKQVNDATLTVSEGDKFRVFIRPATKNLNKNAKAKVIISKESQTVFEPYTGGKISPSPEYPQEIVSAGDTGEIEVDVRGMNLLKPTWHNALVKDIIEAFDDGTFHFVKKKTLPVEIVAKPITDILSEMSDDEELYITIKEISDITYNYQIVFKNYTDTICAAVNGDIKKITYGEIKKATYMQLYFYNIGGVNIGDEFRIVISRNPNCDYEPYQQTQSLIIQTPNGLPGIPVLFGGNYTDANGQQWISDEIDLKRGVRINKIDMFDAKKYEWVDSWESDFPDTTGETHIFNNKKALYEVGVRNRSSYCNCFPYSNVADAKKVNVFSVGNGDGVLAVRVSSNIASNKEEWNEYINTHDVIFALLLKEQYWTETPLTTEEIKAYKALHTNKPTTVITNDADAWMEVSYVADTKTYIDNKFAELNSALANTQAQLL